MVDLRAAPKQHYSLEEVQRLMQQQRTAFEAERLTRHPQVFAAESP